MGDGDIGVSGATAHKHVEMEPVQEQDFVTVHLHLTVVLIAMEKIQNQKK